MKRIFGYSILVFLLIIGGLGIWAWTPDKPRAELESLYLQSIGDLIEVDGVRLHVRDSGPKSATALVMLHGFGASLHTWEDWAGELEDSYRVIRLDLPGSGLSSMDPSGDYSDVRTVELLIALLDNLGLERAVFIGNSIGGRLSWRLASKYPGRVAGVVLVSPDGYASTGFEYGESPYIPPAVNIMQYMLPKAFLAASIKPAYGDPARIRPEVVTRYHDLMLAPGSREALIARMSQTVLVDPLPRLQRIEAPVLLLWGDRDGMIPIANADNYVAALPNVTFVPLRGLGHVPQEEAPKISVVPVRKFLDSL